MKRVLIIEDDKWLADSYANCLQRRGFAPTIASSATQAMELIDERLPDIVVADIILGKHNALNLLQELQTYADTAELPVVVCTSLSLSGRELSNIRNYGVVEVLAKASLKPDTLADVVRAYAR